MTPEEIRQGEVAIAKAMGYEKYYSDITHMWHIHNPFTKRSSIGCIETDEHCWPRYSTDPAAHLELMKWLADRCNLLGAEKFEGKWRAYFDTGYVSGFAKGESQEIACFNMALHFPEVQAHLPPLPVVAEKGGDG